MTTYYRDVLAPALVANARAVARPGVCGCRICLLTRAEDAGLLKRAA